jgi:hypothetical protein
MSVLLVPPSISHSEQEEFAALKDGILKLNPSRLRTPEMPAVTPAAPPADPAAQRQALEHALKRAATIGWFKPERLVTKTVGLAKDQVLSDLVANCEVQGDHGRKLWRLRREPRRELLTTLMDSAELPRLLKETASLAKDPDAKLLRQALRGRPINAARARTDDARASMLRVAEWTQGILDNGPQPMEVRSAIARDAVLDSLNQLISSFHGRTAELKLLRTFCTEQTPRPGPPFLGISGIGGAGKSALLARFADRLLAMPESRRPSVVLIDFDRARFSSGDPLALTFEVTRQVAAWFPDLGNDLRQLRHDVRRNVQSSSASTKQESDYGELESATRGNKELFSRLGSILNQARIGTSGGRPLVMVLDTFEVLQGHDSSGSAGFRGAAAVVNWVRDLFDCGLANLRVIVAGRAPIAEDPVFGPALTEPELLLRGLDPEAARGVLLDSGLKAKDARLVADAVGDPQNGTCNPLVLRLAARLVKGGKVKPSSLKNDARGRASLDAELVQGVLYQRILKHLGDREEDKALAELAHPGLVLRRVTPDLIKHLLIPLTALKKRRGIHAQELFDRLSREVWLVRSAGSNAVAHRTDLRRTMLKLIDADPSVNARRIHRAAIKYYESGRDSGWSAEMAAGEAYYHRLMLLDRRQAARIKAADVHRFQSTLLPTLEDLPPHVLAIVKLSLDHPLTDKEGLSLPAKRRDEFILRQGERYLANDEPYRALALLEDRPNLRPHWELRALAVTVQWALAKKRGLLRVPESNNNLDRATLAAWVCFCLRDPSATLLALVGPGAPAAMQESWARLPGSDLHHVLRAFIYSTIATRDARLSRNVLFKGVPWKQLRDQQLSSTGVALEATRSAVLSAATREPDARLVITGESLPPSTRLLTRLTKTLPPSAALSIKPLIQQLRELGSRSSSGQILGTIARSFSSPLLADAAEWTTLDDDWPILCPNPEFRGPAKFAVIDAFTTKSDYRFVASSAAALIDMRPHDFHPKRFADRASIPGLAGQEIAALIQFVDRSGKLGPLLKRLRARKPKAAKLRLVGEAFERWQRAMSPRGPYE